MTNRSFQVRNGLIDVNTPFYATGNKVVIGSSTSNVTFEVIGTDAVQLPSGNTGQRPTGINGYLRYNSETNQIEGFINSAWANLSYGEAVSGPGTSVNNAIAVWNGTSGALLRESSFLIVEPSLQLSNTGNPGIELRSTAGGTPFIDFSANSSVDYHARLILSSESQLNIEGVDIVTTKSITSNTLVISTGASGNPAINTTAGDWYFGDVNPTLKMQGDGSSSIFGANAAGGNRWSIVLKDNTAESGGNAGSDFYIQRYDDSGAYIDYALSITRSTGDIYFNSPTNYFYGNITVNKSGPTIDLQATASAQNRAIQGWTNANLRWAAVWGNTEAESGSNAGSNFDILSYNDAGAYTGIPFKIHRANSVVQFSNIPNIGGTSFDTYYVPSGSSQNITGRKVAVANGTGTATMANNTGSLGELEIQGSGAGGAAMMSFHRPGAYAAYLGIDTDNYWKVGGWSMGSASYDMIHAGVTTLRAYGWGLTPYDAGTFSSGTYTPSPATGNFAYLVNNGAFTFGVPSYYCSMVVFITNGASAGAITTSGFTKVTGDSFTTTNGDDFMCYVNTHRNTGAAFHHLHVVAMQ